ncbi:MAG: hydrogen gas-evolving membrane-bound hydrogenase subunit E [Verrucomicrobiota bacterium]
MILDTLHPAWLVLAPFFAAALAISVTRRESFPRIFDYVLPLIPAGIFVSLSIAAFQGAGKGPWRDSIAWAPDLGVNWDLWVSPIGLLLALLVSGIGFLIITYAIGYMKGYPDKARLLAMLLLFMGAMMGIALTENLVVLFVFWELTSIASYLLIGFYHSKENSRKSARDALLITGSGGVIFLAGILLIGEVGGSYLISDLLANRDGIQAHALYPAIFICFFLGAITKSAQFPFHFWLPGAMTAPAPVSAYLHSATMVKAGVFLLAFLHPILGETPLWHYSLLGFGAITMTWGALAAMVQVDLKRLLAFSTVSALGTLVMLLGTEHTLAAKAAVVFLIVHALYKGALFMVAGIIDKATGTRDVTLLTGLAKSYPVLAIASVLAALSMSGIPPFIGFIAKELLYEVKLEKPFVGWSLLICGFVASAANIVVAAKVGIAPFLGSQSDQITPKKTISRAMVLGPLVLGAGSLFLGLAANEVLAPGISAIVGQIQTEEVKIKLKLWHGFNLVLLLSLLTVLAGIGGFFARHFFQRVADRIKEALGWTGVGTFRALLEGLLAACNRITLILQSGNLRNYLLIVLGCAVGLITWGFVQADYSFYFGELDRPRVSVMIVTFLIATATILLLRSKRRMTSVFLLGGIGFGLAAFFGLNGAPDLAITQILVETLTLLLFALAIRSLPALPSSGERKAGRFLSVAMASAVGITFTLLMLKALDVQIQEPVANTIAALSVPEGHGRNVVNVILVDFRALDTLGEICVLAIAAIGVAAMLNAERSSSGAALLPPTSSVLLASARYTAPAMLVFAVYLLLRGHNDPGGGFIGGLVAGMAAVLSNLARPDKPLTFARLKPITLIALGIAFAAISGVPGWISDSTFLLAQWGPEFSFPAVGKIKLGTPLIFDIGVFLVVVGIVLLLHRSFERSHSIARPLSSAS